MSKKFVPDGGGDTGYREPFYLQTKFLACLSLLAGFVPVVGFIVAALLIKKDSTRAEYCDDVDAYAAFVRAKVDSDIQNVFAEAEVKIAKVDADIADKIAAAHAEEQNILSAAKRELVVLENKIANRKETVAEIVAEATRQAEQKNLDARHELERIQAEIAKRDFYLCEVETIKDTLADLQHKATAQAEKVDALMRLRKAVNGAVKKYLTNAVNVSEQMINLTPGLVREVETLAPSVMLKLHSMDYRDLRRAFRANEKLIEGTLTRYEDRYTTKTNRTIYRLMVIALRAELQNILYTLTSSKLNDAVGKVRDVANKYLNIAREGNQTISSTLAKFVGEIESLFIDAVKIEYEYYVKREAARQEQLELRAKMREEAEEQRRLREQQAQMEREEFKYNSEIENLLAQVSTTDDEQKNQALLDKIRDLELQLADLSTKKDEIINLQNGKAGYVYVISNLGSFGDDVFKVGMTRRLNPQERIDELGSASVPFKFDVHSFIFSQDAVKLESDLHAALDSRRLNKVNLRKEFFKIPIDDLERLVEQFDPAAEFNRTMQAEQYYQSLSVAE